VNDRKTALLIFLAGLFVFTFATSYLEFLRMDCRFGVFANEMKEYGIGLFPTLYGKAYTDYPATQTILIYLSSRLFGGLSMFTASLPSAIAGALTLSFIYLIGALRSRRVGFYGVIFSFLTYGFLSAARSPSTDIFITAVTACVFYITHNSEERNAKVPLLFIPFLLAAGFAFRGPIGLIIPAAVIFAYYAVSGKYKKAVIGGILSGVVLLLCVAAFYYAALHQGGKEFADEIINSQIHSRMSKQKHIFYYFTDAFGVYSLAYPLALIVIVSSWKKLFSRSDDKDIKFIKQLSAWAFIIMLGLSVPGTKHMRYILPVIPALSLICAFIFEEATNGSFIPFFRRFLIKTVMILTFICAILFPIAHIVFKSITLPIEVNIAFLIPAFILLAITMSVYHSLKKNMTPEKKSLGLLALAALSFVLLDISFIEPLYQGIESSSAFVKKTEFQRILSGSNLFFYRTGPDGEDIKYMVNTERPVIPGFISSPDDIEALSATDIIISGESEFDKLPPEIKDNCLSVCRGKMGHRKFISFQYNPK